MKRVMLFFGSFNPIHKGHIALAEYVVAQQLCDELIMIVSPQNPLKSPSALAPELERFAMAEIAAAESRFPDKIKPSVIEFMLAKPSYTINTLRHLQREYGDVMQFSILMGADLIEQLDQWKDYEDILRDYPIFVYPREGSSAEVYGDRVTFMAAAPSFAVSSTQIRDRLRFGESVDGLLHQSVVKHIKTQALWEDDEARGSAAMLIERGRYHYRHEAWGDALNSFNRALAIEPTSVEAKELQKMTQQILEYRYTDIYNP